MFLNTKLAQRAAESTCLKAAHDEPEFSQAVLKQFDSFTF